MHSLLINQNDPELIKLLKASTVAYTKAKSGEMKITYSLVFLAIAYPIANVIIEDQNVKLVLFGCSFLLTVLIQVFTDSFKGNTTTGAILKECFDTKVFRMRWKSTLSKPDHAEISQLALEYKSIDINNWYSPLVSAEIPANVCVALLQHTNTSWDIALRIKYRRYLIGFLIIYSIALWIFLILFNTSALEIFLIYFSILSFYTHFITVIRGHSSAIRKRTKISKHLDDIIINRKDISNEDLRDIQDEIFSTRQEAAKVPNFFFRWHQKKMNAATEDYITSANKIWQEKQMEFDALV